jgi:hypothetical protein
MSLSNSNSSKEAAALIVLTIEAIRLSGREAIAYAICSKLVAISYPQIVTGYQWKMVQAIWQVAANSYKLQYEFESLLTMPTTTLEQ